MTTKSVAISAGGDRAAITAGKIQFDARVKRGSATVHDSTSPKWRAAARLVPLDGRLAWFGWSVAVWGDVAVVGRPTKSGPSYNNAVYAYRRNPSDGGWTEAALLQPREGPTRGRSFGWSLSVSSDRTVAVGAKDDGGGSVYAFRPSPAGEDGGGGPSPSWIEEGRIVADDWAHNRYDSLGYDVALSERVDMLVAGSPSSHGTSTGAEAFDRGAAYVFRHDRSTAG